MEVSNTCCHVTLGLKIAESLLDLNQEDQELKKRQKYHFRDFFYPYEPTPIITKVKKEVEYYAT